MSSPKYGITREEYISRIVPTLGMDSIATDLAEFLGISRDEVERRARSAEKDIELRQEWLRRGIRIDETAVREFYSASDSGYLFAHAFSDRAFYGKYAMIKPHLSGETVLDYGAGIGSVAMLIARFGSQTVTSADLPSAHAKFAAFRFAKYGLPIRCIEIPAAGYPAGTWDTIYSLDVLEHVVEWRGLLDWMSRSITPGGRLILRVAFDLYEDGALHVSDRTGLSENALLKLAASLRLRRVPAEGEDLFTWSRD